VVGDLAFKQIGKRTGVYTEPSMLDKVANELSDLELFLDTAEEYLIPYPWGTYNIVVMPPSYPMGGMENPLLTLLPPLLSLVTSRKLTLLSMKSCTLGLVMQSLVKTGRTSG